MSVRIVEGDCRDAIKELADCTIDSCVTDPPYALTANKKGGAGVASINLDSPCGRSRVGTGNGAGGFMGMKWDNGDVAFDPGFWREILRVLKPGAHLVSFGGTRTYHRMACAIEDAGFEIRDQLQWLYGSGFPKSHDISKAIDRSLGAERKVIRTAKYRDIRNGHGRGLGDGINASARKKPEYLEHAFTAPATNDARRWEGFGTALKPASEPIVLARKPLSEKTVAANVLKWGTGALNIDRCRIKTRENLNGNKRWRSKNGRAGEASADRRYAENGAVNFAALPGPRGGAPEGRWPANVCHDGSDEVLAGFPDSDGQQGDVRGTEPSRPFSGHVYGDMNGRHSAAARNDSGSAARFFYCAKADSDDRLGSKHPTVKPVDLMRWLCVLVTPPGGTVLDPFCGSGSTLVAADRAQFSAIGIEHEAQYVLDARRKFERDAGMFASGAT